MSSTGLYVLASATSPIPLSYLDYNFNYVNEKVSLVSSTVAAISTTVNALSATVSGLSATVGSIYNSLSNVSITVFLQGQPSSSSSSSSSNVWSIIGSNTFVPSQTVSVSNELSFSSALSTTKLTLLSFTSPVSTTGIYSLSPNIGLAFSGSGALLSNGYIEFNNNYINASPTAAIFQPYGYGGTLNYAYPEWFGSATSSSFGFYAAAAVSSVLVCNNLYSSFTWVQLYNMSPPIFIGSGTFAFFSLSNLSGTLVSQTWIGLSFTASNSLFGRMQFCSFYSCNSCSSVSTLQNCSFNNCSNLSFNGQIYNCSFNSCTNLSFNGAVYSSTITASMSVGLTGGLYYSVIQQCPTSLILNANNGNSATLIGNQFLSNSRYGWSYTEGGLVYCIGNYFANNGASVSGLQIGCGPAGALWLYNNTTSATYLAWITSNTTLPSTVWAANNSGTLLLNGNGYTLYSTLQASTSTSNTYPLP